MKKKVFGIAGIVAVVVACSLGYCGEEEREREEPRGQKIPALEIGYEFTYFYYKESVVFGPDMQESGMLHGPRAMGTYLPGKLMLRGEVHYWTGELGYDGHLQNGSPLRTDTEDDLYDVRGLIGLDLRSDSSTEAAILFTGIGYRYWNDTIGSPYGYEREIAQLYMPLIGMDMSRRTESKGAWGVRGELDILLHGTVASHLSDVSPAYDDAENEQKVGTGFGMRFSFYYRFPIGQSTSISLEPFLGWWHVAQSEESEEVRLGSKTGTVNEPENDTLTAGVGASLCW